MINIRFLLALLSVVLYQVLKVIIHPANSSLIKVVITLLLWFSFSICLSNFSKNYQHIKTDFSKFSFFILLSIIGWNLFNIARSALNHDGNIMTLLGNPVTSLALLTPFAISFYYPGLNFKTLNNLLIALIIIAVPAYFIFFILSGGTKEINPNLPFLYLLYGTNFLITLLYFQQFKKRVIIIIGSILLYFLATVTEYRIANARIFLLYVVLLIFLLVKNFNRKIILYPALVCLALPFFLLIDSLRGGESPFEKYSPQLTNEELTMDTRTFLYTEVFDDLITSNCLLFGKGSNGTYYSPYFDQYGGDTDKRLSPEVGFLAILLKGGVVAALLNFILLFTAIFYSFFKSGNDFVVCVGLMLILHTIILFITNYLDYSLYNVALWFFTGICLSKKIRSYSNKQIKEMLFYE